MVVREVAVVLHQHRSQLVQPLRHLSLPAFAPWTSVVEDRRVSISSEGHRTQSMSCKSGHCAKDIFAEQGEATYDGSALNWAGLRKC
jgi:hypothetical protein